MHDKYLNKMYAYTYISEKEDITSIFWSNYVERGFFYLDSNHEAQFQYQFPETAEDKRICNWCGQVQNLETRVVQPDPYIVKK